MLKPGWPPTNTPAKSPSSPNSPSPQPAKSCAAHCAKQDDIEPVLTKCYDCHIERDKILQILKNHQADLEKLDVESLAIFGSTARNQATTTSDIDVLVTFRGQATFDKFMDLKFYLEDLLDRSIDLVTKSAVRPQLQSSIESDAIYVT
ncbi:MAG: nucleotidyltransferase family protein [Chloroflexota bacterium]